MGFPFSFFLLHAAFTVWNMFSLRIQKKTCESVKILLWVCLGGNKSYWHDMLTMSAFFFMCKLVMSSCHPAIVKCMAENTYNKKGLKEKYKPKQMHGILTCFWGQGCLSCTNRADLLYLRAFKLMFKMLQKQGTSEEPGHIWAQSWTKERKKEPKKDRKSIYKCKPFLLKSAAL